MDDDGENNAWVSNDLEILRSGLYADAKIICNGGLSTKVHRNILASRSSWFKTAFSSDHISGGFREVTGSNEITLEETASQVKLMLHFLYAGSVDQTDETVTGGRDTMILGIDLMRLGERYWSEDMEQYGKALLVTHLGSILDRVCHTGLTVPVMEARFAAEEDEDAFPTMFCLAVRNAFVERPVKLAQRILADFAFAARLHLFKNADFVRLITQGQVRKFGNLVLASMITGDVSGEFCGNTTFAKWQDWRFFPRSPAPVPFLVRIPPGPRPAVEATGDWTVETPGWFDTD
ncbi:hypothetical protein KVR01_012083 [Diaporthe batatas]|uniref:uncharacterized protein n=1 Tax=Diaporthe batatas TaxID=748121 RepID=UPI001D03798A|nr:uncharacterized protein KVR01_012083 [Diaporthe batatas]KAG8158322.1 hypothetical protein KVR01_012083 [Diaporthe batatas]